MDKAYEGRFLYAAALPYTLADASLARELMHPEMGGPPPASLAEVVVAPFGETAPHAHPSSSHVIHVLEGRGSMRIENRIFPLETRDTVFVPAGAVHQVQNSGDCFLRFLCFFTPPHRHGDTSIIEDKP